MKKERSEELKIFKSLNLKDKLVLRIIHESVILNHYPPTIREISRALKIAKKELPIIVDKEKIGSKSNFAIQYSLKKLENLGFIKRDENINRGIKITEKESILPPILRYEGNITDSDLHYLQP